MPLLRLHQFAEGENRYRASVEFENGGLRRSAGARFEFQLSAQDQEDIRWYLEDFLQYPMDPAPAIAARIEQRMERGRHRAVPQGVGANADLARSAA